MWKIQIGWFPTAHQTILTAHSLKNTGLTNPLKKNMCIFSLSLPWGGGIALCKWPSSIKFFMYLAQLISNFYFYVIFVHHSPWSCCSWPSMMEFCMYLDYLICKALVIILLYFFFHRFSNFFVFLLPYLSLIFFRVLSQLRICRPPLPSEVVKVVKKNLHAFQNILRWRKKSTKEILFSKIVKKLFPKFRPISKNYFWVCFGRF